MTRILLLALVLVIGCSAQTKDSYCAFEVHVSDIGGKPMKNIDVTLVKDRHGIVDVFTDEHGVARICDSPNEPVTIAAGFKPCGIPTVEGIRPLWQGTRVIRLTFDNRECPELAWEIKPCHLVLRIRDSGDRPVSAAHFRGFFGSKWQDLASDSFGRVFVSLPNGRSARGTVEKPGFRAKEFRAFCDSEGATDRDIAVTLVSK